MEAQGKIEIQGKHNLANTSYRRAIIETALEVLDYLEVTEESAYQISDIVLSRLGFPVSEKIMIMNAIAPKSQKVTKSFLTGSLALLRPSAEEVLNNPVANCKAEPHIPAKSASETLKEEILSVLNQYHVVPCSYLEKRFASLLAAIPCSLDAFLSVRFTSQELIQSQGIVAAQGYSASADELTSLILEENGHKPFNINVLGARFGLTADEVRAKLKHRELYSFVQWSTYETWSLSDVKTTEEAKDKIARSVSLSPLGPLLLIDIFHCMFVGVIAENIYEDINEEARIYCAQRGLADSGFFDYEFDKNTQAFYKKGRKIIGGNKTLLYKVF